MPLNGLYVLGRLQFPVSVNSSYSLLMNVQVLNLTELELNRVDIRVGLSGALYFMDGSPQAVRQLRSLVSQVSFLPL